MVNANDLQDYYPTHSYSESGKYLEAPNKTIIDQVPDNYFIDNDGKSICIVSHHTNYLEVLKVMRI